MNYGFEQSKDDPTLYVRVRDESSVIFVVHVDDIAMSSNSNNPLDL